MGTMTLTDFRSELLFDLKNRSDTTNPGGLTTLRQNLFINSAYLHVTHPSVFRHRELQYTATIPLVATQSNYTFSPDSSAVTIVAIRSVSHLVPATFRLVKLLPKDQQWFMARSPQNGAPREYFTEGNEINLNPIPGTNEAGDVLVLSTWRQPALLSGALDTTTLSSRFDEIVLLAARWRAELHLGYRDLAEATKIDFVSLLNEYKSHEDLHGEDWDWQSDVISESVMDRV